MDTSDQSVEPVDQSVEPVGQLVEPVGQSAELVDQLVEPVDQLVGPVDQSVEPVEQSAGPASSVDPTGELTPSGFRRRNRGHEGAPVAVVAVESHEDPSDSPPRDADSVQASLARFRAGVTQGRAAVDQIDGPSDTDDRSGR